MLAYGLGQDATAVRAWLGLMFVRGVGEADPAAIETTLGFVDAALDRLGNPPALQIERDRVVGSIYAFSGDTDKAGPLLARAAERLASRHGKHSVSYALAREMWGIQAAHAQEFDDGRTALSEARAIYETHFGARAAVVARAAANLGALEATAGRYDQAARHAAEAVDIMAEQVGPNDASLAVYRGALATALVAGGRTEEGLSQYEQALGAFENLLDPDEPRLVNARYQVAWASGIAALELEPASPRRELLLERAQAQLRACLPHVEAVPDELHGRIRLQLGEIALLAQDYDEARSQCQRSAAIWTKPSGPGATVCIEEAVAGLVRQKELDESM